MTIQKQTDRTSAGDHAHYQHTPRRLAVRQEVQTGSVYTMAAGEGLFTSEVSVPLNLPASEPCLLSPYKLILLTGEPSYHKKQAQLPAPQTSSNHRSTPFAQPYSSPTLNPNQNNTKLAEPLRKYA
jgi:hypothetical protein